MLYGETNTILANPLFWDMINRIKNHKITILQKQFFFIKLSFQMVQYTEKSSNNKKGNYSSKHFSKENVFGLSILLWEM